MTPDQLKELESLAAGFEASAYAETRLLDALAPEIAAFNAGARDDHTMRQLRISNDARSNASNSRRSAVAIKAALMALRGYQIQPAWEPHGEGNGWFPCDEDSAEGFEVWHLADDWLVEMTETRAQAEAFVLSLNKEPTG